MAENKTVAEDTELQQNIAILHLLAPSKSDTDVENCMEATVAEEKSVVKENTAIEEKISDKTKEST